MGFDSKYGFTLLGLSQDFSEKVGSKSQYGVRVGGFPGRSVVKNPPAKAETRVQSLIWEVHTCPRVTKPELVLKSLEASTV